MIEQLAQQIFSDINQKVGQLSGGQDQAASQIRAVIESALRKLNLVTREEFDAQQAVLLRTREKLEQLESRLAEFEKTHNAAS